MKFSGIALSRVVSVILLGAWVWVSTADAQDVNAPGRYGVVDLRGNFTPDPHTVNVEAGGPDDASALLSGCSGMIDASQPDYELNYSDPVQYSLGFFVIGDVDTTLVVNDPSGEWHCNDDFSDLGGTNPGIEFPSPMEGNYDVWVGAYDATDNGADVELVITEAGAPWEPVYGEIELTSNFSPDPQVNQIVAGGNDAASTLSPDCVGYVNASRPDFGFTYNEAGRFRLSVFADGNIDSTLVVQDPSGHWYCNDDFSTEGGSNPGIQFGNPVDGFYSVWVGAYEQTDSGATVDLIVTELGSPWDGTSNSSAGGDGTQLIASGTGFVVSSQGHVLTNHHVIEECTRMTFQIRGQLAVEADLLSSNQAVDLALLKADVSVDRPARFRGGQTIRLGDDVVVFGFPLLGDLSSQGNITYGIVSALSGLNDDLSRMQITAQIQPGNSGGPVMDHAGNIVGVVVETANDEYFREQRGTAPQNVNFAIRDSLARSFLDTNNVGYGVATATGQISIADIAEQAQQFTGIILCYR